VARVLDDPLPAVHLDAFGPDGLDLLVSFWIADPENGSGNVKSEVNLSILSVLNDQGVSIPYPQRELLVKGERPIVGGT
jgi:small-conductance mechanosensitive channel